MTSNPNNNEKNVQNKKYSPGEGIRSLRTTNLFRVVNYELYAKPNLVIMGIGAVCFGSALAYITYMKWKYEKLGYYEAIQEDGSQIFAKKKSKWND